MAGHVGLIVKATRLCNLRCAYCHDWRAGAHQTMAFPVLARMIASALQDPVHAVVNFMWHGGETLVLTPAFYEKALYLQARFQRPGQRILNTLQTNGTLVDPAWARFFRANEFKVSVSLDGPAAIHDQHRVYASGRPSFAHVQRGMRVLRDHGVPFSVLMVIDESALALGATAIFDFFLEQGISSYGLLAAAPENQPNAPSCTPTKHYVDPARMNAFLIAMYDRWVAHGDERIRIRELEAIRKQLDHTAGAVCTLAGRCHGLYYSVEPNGDVAHCDLYVGDPRFTLGNVGEHSFAALRARAELLALEEQNERALEGMRGCPDFAVCNGWCPHERYLSVRHSPVHDPGCCGLRSLIDHVREDELRRRRVDITGLTKSFA